MLIYIEMKFTAPRTEGTPVTYNEKVARSTDAPTCVVPLARGGFTVQSVTSPLSTFLLEVLLFFMVWGLSALQS
jgi:hypothetical protein